MPTTGYTEFLHNIKKNILNCNMKLNSIQIYNLINFFKKDLQGGFYNLEACVAKYYTI